MAATPETFAQEYYDRALNRFRNVHDHDYFQEWVLANVSGRGFVSSNGTVFIESVARHHVIKRPSTEPIVIVVPRLLFDKGREMIAETLQKGKIVHLGFQVVVSDELAFDLNMVARPLASAYGTHLSEQARQRAVLLQAPSAA